MDTRPDNSPKLPPEQQAIWNRCFHPTGTFIEFSTADTEQSIPDRFEEQVRRHPDRLAVRSKSHQSTYRELNQAANGVARAILAQRQNGQEPIALLVEQGEPMLAPILGVLKAGKIFVPLDPGYPADRTRYMLEDTRTGLVLTNSRNLSLATELVGRGVQLLNMDEIKAGPSGEDLRLPLSPAALSNILYTSGSTGQPKGVVHSHRNVLHQAMLFTQAFHICPEDRLTLLASVTGQAINTIFSGLLNGAALFPLNVKEEGVGSLAAWLIEQEITMYISASPLFRNFMETLSGDEEFPSIRLVRLASQTVFQGDVALYKKHFSPTCIFINGLSSTEANRMRNYYIDKASELTTSTVPVGYAAADKEVCLLDDDGNQVGPGQVGEIVVRSRYLAQGYWEKPELTRAAFQPDPKGGDQRVFHTGDMGRMHPDGCLEHLGRKDSQVKIRGNRIEISEIEMALAAIDNVKESAVVPREDLAGNQRLVAYAVPARHPPPTIGELRRTLAQKLPDYMVPSAFVMLEALPTLPNGKVNRRALPDPCFGRPELQNPFVKPRTPLEEDLCAAWVEVLGLDQVGVHDDFLDLGGDSLLASTLMAHVEKIFQMRLPLSTLMQASTVAQMAQLLKHERLPSGRSSLVAIQPQGERPPFFCVHAVGGHTLGFAALARHLGKDQPFYGLESPGRDGEQPPLTRVEDMATHYINEIRQVQPQGPYYIGGLSMGGRVAFEMGQQLRAQGQEVALLVLLDSGFLVPTTVWKRGWQRVKRGKYLTRRVFHHSRNLLRLRPQAQRKYIREKAQVARGLAVPYSRVRSANAKALEKYVPKPYPGRLTYFWAVDRAENSLHPRDGWRQVAEGGLDIHRVPGDHLTMMREPHVQILARQLKECLVDSQLGHHRGRDARV
ncbi:MAG TPA: alpha/beta fold hydrolase [Dehalococcoidia bacterium]|nr:alpha/beta fold hydrolase [Dehalococcoidia bacterium]